ncbi:MAG: seg [Microgenomates bacterium 39_7]|nr:MAG: seg [Microgenomates bacterium 39_7]
MQKKKLFLVLSVGIFLGLLFLVGLVISNNDLKSKFLQQKTESVDDISPSSPQSEVTPEPISTDSTITTTPKPQLTPTPTTAHPSSIKFNVPFTSQAPLGDWNDPFQQDDCEEASALMAVYWARGEIITSSEAARDIIVDASKWQLQHYQIARDASAEDTASRIIQGYFDWPHVQVKELIGYEQILESLYAGNLVITPMDGQKLGNPNFTGEGPERHMLVIIGYNADTQEFITNDPGTRRGRDYAYDRDLFMAAVRDYPTGDHEPIREEKKAMIVVLKKSF